MLKDKFFIRVGEGNGQKQTHRGHKAAPARRGIWILPAQCSYDLIWLAGSKFEDHQYEDNKTLKTEMKRLYKKYHLSLNKEIWTHLPGKLDKRDPRIF